MKKNKLNYLEKIAFNVIDSLNKKGAHTNPVKIKQNIKGFLEKISLKFTEYLPLNSKGIDIGAGLGILSELLKPRIIYNLDINPPKEGYGIQIKGDAEDINFEGESFDFALLFYAFNHFKNQEKAFSEMYRIVKNKGYIIAMMEFSRYKGQEHLIKLNELSMNKIIYGKNCFSEEINPLKKKDFERLINYFSLKRISIEKFPPTQKIDFIFKSSKYLYVLQK